MTVEAPLALAAMVLLLTLLGVQPLHLVKTLVVLTGSLAAVAVEPLATAILQLVVLVAMAAVEQVTTAAHQALTQAARSTQAVAAAVEIKRLRLVLNTLAVLAVRASLLYAMLIRSQQLLRQRVLHQQPQTVAIVTTNGQEAGALLYNGTLCRVRRKQHSKKSCGCA
jgi:hypothetical protein